MGPITFYRHKRYERLTAPPERCRRRAHDRNLHIGPVVAVRRNGGCFGLIVPHI